MNILKNRFVIVASSGFACSFGIVLIKDYMSGPKYVNSKTLEGKTVVITGANSGLGKELTKQLAKRGARIIMACKDVSRAKEVRNGIVSSGPKADILVRKLDLSSLDSVASFVDKLNKRNDKVDYLVNNAGVMNSKQKFSVDGIEEHLAVNYLGHFLLTNLLLTRRENAPCQKIVNVLCRQKNKKIDFQDLNCDRNPYDNSHAYSQSKYAFFLFTKELAKLMNLKGMSAVVCGVFPGIVNTNLPRNQIESSNFVFRFLYKPFLWLFMKSPHQGVMPILRALLDDLPSGSIYYLDKPYDIVEPNESNDSYKLWLTSEVWARLSKYTSQLNNASISDN